MLETIFGGITAIATSIGALLAYRNMLASCPSFKPYVTDIPGSDDRNRPEREKLQQDGYYILRLCLKEAPEPWNVKAVKISGAQLPCEITSKTGEWLADRLPDKHEITMTHRKVKTPFWRISQSVDNGPWEFLIKPDNPDKGLLEITLYGPLWTQVKVPFEYEKTRYFAVPARATQSASGRPR